MLDLMRSCRRKLVSVRWEFYILFFSAVLYAAYIYRDLLWRGETVKPFNARPIQMALGGSEFWEMRAREQGMRGRNDNNAAADADLISANKNSAICHDFFTLWPSDCVDGSHELDDRLRVLSAQMVEMKANVTLFVTDMKGCSFSYENVIIKRFNATEELIYGGFAEGFPRMANWKKTRYTRTSDILRLCLAHRYKMSYIDSDVTFLQLQKHWYERPYVGAQLWSDNKNAIEITNAAFCLPRTILEDMMGFQKARIVKGSDSYFYTELGPSMFHHVLMNRRAVPLYSQNHPADPSLDRITMEIHKFGHKQLHLTGHVRKGSPQMSFGELVNTIRRKCGLPLLELPPSMLGGGGSIATTAVTSA